jgi:endonuclease YncB( thermonuclease family)
MRFRRWVRLAVIGLVVLAGVLAFIFAVLYPVSTPDGAGEEDGIRVLRVIDGDTMDVADQGRTVRVRLYGADAPERGHPCYDRAADSLREILSEANSRVRLEPGPRARDSGGRTLAYVWVDTGAESRLVDETLVIVGFAEAWRRDGQHRERIIAAEMQARGNGAGCLWG